jgi:hypothetical protein
MAAGLNGRPGGHGEFFRSRCKAKLPRCVDEWAETHHFLLRAWIKSCFRYREFLRGFVRFLALYGRSQ